MAAHLREYRINSVSVGKDAQGEAALEVEYAGEIYHGRAISTDIIDASVRAYVGVINRICAGIIGPAEWQASATVPAERVSDSGGSPSLPATD